MQSASPPLGLEKKKLLAVQQKYRIIDLGNELIEKWILSKMSKVVTKKYRVISRL